MAYLCALYLELNRAVMINIPTEYSHLICFSILFSMFELVSFAEISEWLLSIQYTSTSPGEREEISWQISYGYKCIGA